MTEYRGMGGARIGAESSKLTQLWRDLCSAGKWLPESSPLVTHCQAELWELMRQIDLMMENKQREWRAANDTLQSRLQAREKERVADRSVIEQKTKEVLELRGQLANTEKTHKDAIIGYTTQATKLRDEVAKLKKHYEKMKARHAHDKAKATRELEGGLVELHRVQQELEEQKRLHDSVEAQRKILGSQLESCEAQLKSWADKYDAVQQQLSVHLAQAQKRKQQQAEAESSLKAEVKRLEIELASANGIISGQKSEVDKLRSVELTLRTRVEQLEREMASSRSDDKQAMVATVQRLEAEVRSLTAELRDQGGTPRRNAAGSGADLSGHVGATGSPSQEREIARLEGYLQQKDSIIRELVHRTHSASDETAIVENLRESIVRADERNRKLSEKEVELRLEAVRLRADCDDLRRRLTAADIECASLQEQLNDKAERLQRIEVCELKARDDELAQIKKQLQSTEDRHVTETAALRMELARLESLLESATVDRDRLLNQSSFMDDSASECCSVARRGGGNNYAPPVRRDAASAEERLRAAEAAADAQAAAVKVANSQLDALRLENRLLKEHVVKLSQMSVERREAELHMRDVNRFLEAASASPAMSATAAPDPSDVDGRRHSGTSLALLEDENESLRLIVEQLQDRLLLDAAASLPLQQGSAATASGDSHKVTRRIEMAAVSGRSDRSEASGGRSVPASGRMPGLASSFNAATSAECRSGDGQRTSAALGPSVEPAAAGVEPPANAAGVVHQPAAKAAGVVQQHSSASPFDRSAAVRTVPASTANAHLEASGFDRADSRTAVAAAVVSPHDEESATRLPLSPSASGAAGAKDESTEQQQQHYQLPLTPHTDGRQSSASDPDRQRTPLVPTGTTQFMPAASGTVTADENVPTPLLRVDAVAAVATAGSWRTPPRKSSAAYANRGDAALSRTATLPPGAALDSAAVASDEHTRRWLLDRPLLTPDLERPLLTPDYERELLRKQIDRTGRQLESLNSTFIAQSLDDSLLSEYPERLRAGSVRSQTDVESLSQAFDLSCDEFAERPESASARFLVEREQRARELQLLLNRRLLDLRDVGHLL